MSSKKNVGRKRLGRIQISGTGQVAGDNGRHIDRPFQLQSKFPKSIQTLSEASAADDFKNVPTKEDFAQEVQFLFLSNEVPRSQNIKDDLSFSTSFACDLDSDLDLMSALDKMENDFGNTDRKVHANIKTRNGTTKGEHIPQKLTEKMYSAVGRGAHIETNAIVTTPIVPKSGRKRKASRSSVVNTDNSINAFDSFTWDSPVNVSTPLDTRPPRALRSNRKVKDIHTTGKEAVKDDKNVKTRKKSLTPKNTPKASNLKCERRRQSFDQSNNTGPISSKETSKSEFFQSLLLDNDSMEISLNQNNKLKETDDSGIKTSAKEKEGTIEKTNFQTPNRTAAKTISETGGAAQKGDDGRLGQEKHSSVDDKNAMASLKSSPEPVMKDDSVDETNKSSATVIQSGQLSLSSWGLPEPVLKQYTQRGITHMFEWQAECLLTGNVLGGGNLVYSAPTSAGKTMVAELLVLKKVVETKKKAIIILPFVSVTREKMFYLQELYQDSGIRVGGFMGHSAPANGFSSVDVAVCTIEKGNGLINRLLEDNKLDKLGIIVVDELHLVGDPHRGYLLELLLTKISYMAKKAVDIPGENNGGNPIQIVGMSATLPNLDLLATWLNADLYRTDYRPVPLQECMKIGTAVYNSNMEIIRDIDVTYKVKGDTEHVVPLCIETIRGGHSILIFCPTKNWCEKLAETVAREFYNLLRNPEVATTVNSESSQKAGILILPLNPASLRDVVEQLKRTPIGVDQMLGRTVPFGVAYHHAGLTFDERDIVEGAFRQGILKVLVATSTLSSGVNLPARRVLIRTPVFHGGKVIDFLTYKQMIGRAGRKGVDTAGESILLCKPNERSKAVELVTGQLPPVKSTLIRNESEELSSSMKRAILEVVVSGVAMETKDVACYASCTMLAASLPSDSDQTKKLIDQCIGFLQENEFVCKQSITNEEGQVSVRFIPTQLGAAVLASSLSPDEGLAVFSELQRARQCFVLENELHVIYQVTPIYSGIGDYIDWYQFFCIWENMSPGMRRVAEIIGVQESYLAKSVRGKPPCKTNAQLISYAIHRDSILHLYYMIWFRRFPSEMWLRGMVTVFCARLGWSNLELILSQFQNRLTFGVQRELCDLVRISTLNGQRARVLYNGGYQTVAALASAHPADVEALLKNSAPFQSTKRQGMETEWEAEERRKSRCIFLTGRKGVTEYEAAVIITDEAKAMIQEELGGLGIQWDGADKTKAVEITSPVVTSPLPTQQRSLIAKPRLSLLKRKSPHSSNFSNSQSKTDKQSKKACPATKQRKGISPRENMSVECILSPPNLCNKIPDVKHDICEIQNQVQTKLKNSVSKGENCLESIQENGLSEPKENHEISEISVKKNKITNLEHALQNQEPQIKDFENINNTKKNSLIDISIEHDNNSHKIQTTSNSKTSTRLSELYEKKNDKTTLPSAKKKPVPITNTQDEANIVKDSGLSKKVNIDLSKEVNIDLSEEVNILDQIEINEGSELALKNQNIYTGLSNKDVTNQEVRRMDEVHNLAIDKSPKCKTDIIDDDFLETFVLDTQTANSIICDLNKVPCNKRDGKALDHVDKGDDDISDDFNSEALFSERVDHSPNKDNVVIDSINKKTINEHFHESMEDDLQLKLSESFESDNNTCHDLDMNVFQNSNEDMFNTSEDIIAASNYERVGLSGETGVNDDRLNSSYEDLHIPYQSGQEVCFEKANAVDHIKYGRNVGDSSVVGGGDKRQVSGNKIGLFSSPEPMVYNNKNVVPGCDNSFSSTFNISDMNLDALNVPCGNKKENKGIEPSNSKVTVNKTECRGTDDRVSPKENCNFSDSLTVSMIDRVLEDNFGDNPPSKPEICKVRSSSPMPICDNVIYDNTSDNDNVIQIVIDKSSRVLNENTEEVNKGTVVKSIQTSSITANAPFITPKGRAVKRSRQTPTDKNAKVLKTMDSKYSTPEAKRKDSMRIIVSNTSKSVPISEKKQNMDVNTDEEQSSPLHNISAGSDCVPPTPPGEDELGNTETPKRTPLRSLNSMGFSPRLKPSGKETTTDLRKQGKVITNDKCKTPVVPEHPLSNELQCTGEMEVKITQTDNVARLSHVDDDIKSEGEEEREDKLSPSFIDPEESGLPLTQASFTIIDVCADKRLFKTFIMEWRSKSRYAVSMACEKRPQLATNRGIGSNYRKASSPVPETSAQTEDGIILEGRDLVIVGVAVSWDNRDAYYVSFTHRQAQGNLDDSLAQPPSDTDISLGIRIKAVKSVLQQAVCRQQSVTMVMFDVKSQYRVLAEGCGFVPKGNFEDPRVACWMLDPGARERTLHGMVTNLLPSEVHLLQGIGGGIGLGSMGLSPENPGSGRYRATTECVLVRHLGEYFRACLNKEALYSVFSEVEMPAAISLCRMELNGFGFSQEESESQKSVMIAKLSALEEQAYALAGHPFSLSATEDISQILYMELQLPVNGEQSSVSVKTLAPRGMATRKTKAKSQHSTSKDVLEKLKKLHPLPGVILEWRRITNALTKVVFPLQKEKIHCENLSMYRIYSECQLHSATGRVSLSEPNLQNVPKDFEIVMPDMIGESPTESTKSTRRSTRGGSKLQQMIGLKQLAKVTDENKGIKFSVSMRHAFVPFKGGLLLAADYSQLELRMIAYLSNDDKLIHVLNADGDVFKLITAQWKNIRPDEVTPEQRAQAKQVCYGMIYGIGPRALGEQLEVDENDAAAFIETFKAKYPGMRKYLRKTVELCREKGYVQTMVGRKRYLPSITSTNPHGRGQAERQAVNTTVQGSAADLVKRAMIKIDESLEQKYPLSQYAHRQKLPGKHPARQKSTPEGGYLVLQLHDELIYEVNHTHVKEVALMVKHCMENAMELPVKMPVKVKMGASWGTLEEFEP